MKRKKRSIATGIGLIIVVVFIAVVISLIIKLTPSKKVMELTEYYPVKDKEILIILQDTQYEKRGLYIDKQIYLDYETVTTYFNKRFFWDNNENILSYTTPNEIIKTQVESTTYYINNRKNKVSYPIVKAEGNTVYLALEFVKQYSNIDYQIYDNPNRAVIQYQWDKDFSYSNVKKATQLRVEPNIKSDILVQLSKDTKLLYLNIDEELPNKFSKVMTTDGVIGYVKDNKLAEKYYEKIKNDYQEPNYTHILREDKITLAWHQVTTPEANNNLLTYLNGTRGINVISPTWFKLKDGEGNISSIASETYVERAHNAGLEVWGLVKDFGDTEEITIEQVQQVLSYTSKREKLENALISEAIKYNLDGINVDFEQVKERFVSGYLQFLRELSVKCRNNGLILSVDNYVPMDYNAFYDFEEQASIVDYVIIMAYDEHTDKTGPVSSLNYVKNATEKTLTMVPKEQTIIGIPFYTKLWEETTAEDGTVTLKKPITNYSIQGGKEILSNRNIEPKWDKEAGQYYGEYEENGALCRIWLEEDKSIEEKMKVIYKNEVAGVACWKLGLETESIWNVIVKYMN